MNTLTHLIAAAAQHGPSTCSIGLSIGSDDALAVRLAVWDHDDYDLTEGGNPEVPGISVRWSGTTLKYPTVTVTGTPDHTPEDLLLQLINFMEHARTRTLTETEVAL